MKELGELIRAARQHNDITLEEVSVQTRIRRQYLDAMEEGDFRIFPGPAYVTGFLRNYAAFLGLNPEEILQTYHALTPPPVISIQPATTVAVERMKRRSRRRFTWMFAVLALVLVGAAAVHKYNTDQMRGAGAAPRLPVSTSGLITSRPPLSKPPTQSHAVHSAAPTTSVIAVRALKTTWVRRATNGAVPHWGPVRAGTFRQWSGRTVWIQSHDGTSLLVWANGKPLGLLSHHLRRARLTVTPGHWHRTG